MKKIVIALAAVAMAIGVQAATCSWKVSAGNVFDGSTTKYSGTAYVFTTAMAQSALFDAFVADKSYDFAGAAAGKVTVANGTIAATAANTFVYGEVGDKFDYYFVLVNDDSLYFSNILTQKAGLNPPNVQSLSFGSQNNATSTFSGTAAAEGFQGAGHWSQAVPEPTSGLLLLLGMAGLALKRKHA